MLYRLRRLYHPEYYQGPSRPSPYFEGWYFKLVAGDRALAVIPGISWSPEDPHAFVQWLDGTSHASEYHRYPVDAFQYSKREFAVQVDESHFSLGGISVKLPTLEAELSFESALRWPTSLFAPGTMGPYSFVPGMECNHGVLVMDAAAVGTIDGDDLTSGRIYVEKDWGRSFPRGWVWAQSNSFERPGVSVTCSIARVPFGRRAFAGFIIGFAVDGVLHRFTTYTGARLRQLLVRQAEVEVTVADRRRRLSLRMERAAGAALASPERGAMVGRIAETLDARIHVLLEIDGRQVFDGTGAVAGLEVVNADQIGESSDD